jgi:hypothetical protein
MRMPAWLRSAQEHRRSLEEWPSFLRLQAACTLLTFANAFFMRLQATSALRARFGLICIKAGAPGLVWIVCHGPRSGSRPHNRSGRAQWCGALRPFWPPSDPHVAHRDPHLPCTSFVGATRAE